MSFLSAAMVLCLSHGGRRVVVLSPAGVVLDRG
jgi:hypothetical protein